MTLLFFNIYLLVNQVIKLMNCFRKFLALKGSNQKKRLDNTYDINLEIIYWMITLFLDDNTEGRNEP